MQKIKTIESLIELMRQKNPLIFLRIPSIFYLAMIIDGYKTAIRNHCPDRDDDIMGTSKNLVSQKFRS
jgi:hypothetical protein